MNTNRKALKAGVWYTASNFLCKGSVFFATAVFSRLLTKAEFGLYNNYTACLLIATVLVTLNLDASLVSARFDFRTCLDEYLFSILGLSGLSVLLWALLVNGCPSFFTRLCDIDRMYLNAMLLYLLFSPAVLLYQERARYQFEYQKTAAVSVLVSFGTVMASILLVVLLPNKLFALILGSVLPTVLLGGMLCVWFFRRGKRINVRCWSYALPICLPYIPHLLSMTVLHAMDKVMITHYCGAEDNAVYSLAYTCGSVISLLGMSINSAFSPWLGNKLEENTQTAFQEIRDFSRKYVGAFFAVAVGVIAVAPEVLYLLGGSKYAESRYVLAPISAGCLFQFLYTMFVNVEQYKKKTVGMAIASVTAALINFSLNWYFIPRYGYLAAAYTTLAGYACLLLFHMYLVKRLRLDRIYSYRFVFAVCVLGVVLMILMTLCYRVNAVRYTFLAAYSLVILTILIKYRSEVLRVFKALRH